MSTTVSWKKPLILSATLLAVGTLAIWLEYSHKPKSEALSEEQKKLFRIKDQIITQIKVISGSKTVSFKCSETDLKKCKTGENPKWEILEPIKSKGDESNINSFVSSIGQLSQTENIDLSIETPEKKQQLLKDYKLDDAQKTAKRVEITLQGGQTQIVYIGEIHPVGDSLFAANNLELNQIYIIPTFIQSQLDHPLTHWRDKKLMSLLASSIKKFDYSVSNNKLHFERKDGEWQIEQAGKKDTLPGDIENIDNFLTAVGYLNAKDFAAENKTDKEAAKLLAGAKPIAEFKIEIEAGKDPLVLKTFEKKKGDATLVYATLSNSDPLFLLEDSSKAKLIKKVEELRLSKLITTAERFSIKKIEFNGPGGKTTLENDTKNSKWIVAETKKEATNEKVQSLLDKFSGNRVKTFMSGEKVPNKGAVSVMITNDKDTLKRHLTFWKDKEKSFAKDHLSKRGETLEVDPAIFEALPKASDHFTAAAPATTGAPNQTSDSHGHNPGANPHDGKK